ncbi:MAG: hypothetical protein K9N21_13005 [Deltaproteobacteria bacterium]|jgi:outer membrane protein OmpA-like peptidoglycan-associated protein|nr:hypothetical protein [Deltaproteobacteria bacterium]
MKISPGSFEVELFPEAVNSPDHPYASQFREILEGVAREYDCTLLSFDVNKGTVTFSFDSDELTAEIMRILKENV